ncbi:MAG: hypothetical protein WCT27_05610 [Patescibacteria group bacterium]
MPEIWLVVIALAILVTGFFIGRSDTARRSLSGALILALALIGFLACIGIGFVAIYNWMTISISVILFVVGRLQWKKIKNPSNFLMISVILLGCGALIGALIRLAVLFPHSGPYELPPP